MRAFQGERAESPWARYALFLAAFSWPWDVYQILPVLFVPVSGLAVLALVAWCVCDGLRERRFRGSFELTWPAVAVMAAAIYGLITGEAWPAWKFLGCAACFAAVLHTVRSRETAVQCLWLTALAGGGAAALSLLSRAGVLFPTAFSPQTGATLAFASSLEGGALVLALCATVSWTLALSKHVVPWIRRNAALSGLLAVLALGLLGLRVVTHPELWRPPGWTGMPPGAWVAAAGVFWLVARIAAKAVVARMEDAPGMHAGLLVVLAAGVALSLLWQQGPVLGYGILLGLIAGYVSDWRESQPVRRVPAILKPPVLGVVLLNLLIIFPDNPYDPRNYEYRAARSLESRQFETLERELAFIDRIAPAERRTHLWRARLRLEREDPAGAAIALRRALGESRPRILPPPTPTEVKTFLSRMRDYCSALPEAVRGLAYERALVAAGEPENALALLRLRGQEGKGAVQDKRALVAALATLMGDMALAETLMTWEGKELLGVFETLGARVDRVPEDFQAVYLLPLVLAAQIEEERLILYGFAGPASFGGDCPIPAGGLTPGSGFSTLYRGAQGWHSGFGGLAVVDLGQAASVHFGAAAGVGRVGDGPRMRVFIP